MDNKDVNSPEDDELRDIIEQALKFNIREKKTFKKRKDLANRLGSILSEYLDSYILLGYDFDGRHIDIKSASTPMQAEALNSFLIKYFAIEAQQFKNDPNG